MSDSPVRVTTVPTAAAAATESTVGSGVILGDDVPIAAPPAALAKCATWMSGFELVGLFDTLTAASGAKAFKPH